jgi:hypothetical protein
VSGECYCDEAHEGEACEILRKDAKTCYKDCSSHGLCKNGRCFCAQGFAGVGCEIEVDVTEKLALNAKLNGNQKDGVVNSGTTLTSTTTPANSIFGQIKFTKLTLGVLAVGAGLVGVVFGMVVMQSMRRKQRNSNYHRTKAGGDRWGEHLLSNAASNPFHLNK